MNALNNSIKSIDKTATLNDNFKFRGKTTLYVIRLMNNNDNTPTEMHSNNQKGKKYLLGCSKPCNNCLKMMYKFGIKIVKYTDIINNINVLCTLSINK
jgi:deoxycytidylate deaminase